MKKKIVICLFAMLSTAFANEHSACEKTAKKFMAALEVAQSYSIDSKSSLELISNNDLVDYQITLSGRHLKSNPQIYSQYFCLTLENDSAVKCAYVSLVNSDTPCDN